MRREGWTREKRGNRRRGKDTVGGFKQYYEDERYMGY
jgi:hypothetical protein